MLFLAHPWGSYMAWIKNPRRRTPRISFSYHSEDRPEALRNPIAVKSPPQHQEEGSYVVSWCADWPLHVAVWWWRWWRGGGLVVGVSGYLGAWLGLSPPLRSTASHSRPSCLPLPPFRGQTGWGSERGSRVDFLYCFFTTFFRLFIHANLIWTPLLLFLYPWVNERMN